MKTVPITELRQRAAEIVEQLQGDEEPTVVLQRSRKAAYLLSVEEYERLRAELAALRRALFLAEVREAERERAAGGGRAYEDIERLLDDLRA